MNKKMNKKKENRMAVRQAAAKAVLRDEQNRRIQFAATNPEGEVLKNLRTTLRGLDEDAVTASRAKYGSNKVTHEKKKSLAQRLAGAFVNPFTAILFCLALVSTMTDMVFPYFSLLGSVPEDFDPLTVVIILTMVLISGTLRFVQESRSGNAAEKLLALCGLSPLARERMNRWPAATAATRICRVQPSRKLALKNQSLTFFVQPSAVSPR